ncbi:6684_t:CDS:1, partial [Ambispora gerdemannii]
QTDNGDSKNNNEKEKETEERNQPKQNEKKLTKITKKTYLKTNIKNSSPMIGDEMKKAIEEMKIKTKKRENKNKKRRENEENLPQNQDRCHDHIFRALFDIIINRNFNQSS